MAIPWSRGARVLRLELGRALEEVADALFPPRCRLCGAHAPDALACAEHAFSSAPTGPRCGRCGGALPRAFPDGARCAECARSAPRFARLCALGDYRDPALRAWVLALKHGGRRDLARPLGRALGARLAAEEAGALAAARLVPVPLHPLRRFERGFDQALLLALAASELSGAPLVRALARRRWTPSQGAPGAVSRRANVRGAFALRRRGRESESLAGARAWLVDDVVTSGATADACAAELARAGAAFVGVLCLARAGESGAAGEERAERGGRAGPAQAGG